MAILAGVTLNLKTVQGGGKLVVLVYELSIGTKIGDLEWPWTA